MALYAIGDIHGCATALKTIFEQQFFTTKDTIIFLGDYVDHGPETKEAIDFLLAISNQYQCIFLKGNHEILMENARTSSNNFDEWKENGGAPTLQSYGIVEDENWAEQIDPEHWTLIRNSQPYFETDAFIFVHAGLEPGKKLSDQDAHHLYWKKYFNPQKYNNHQKVLCGHTSRKDGEIANYGHTICIDTYAYGGQWLTCLNVETNEFLKTNEQGKTILGKL